MPDAFPIEHSSAKPKRGRLKIFLGYASGVGKTYRMLDEARRRKERGEDVIVGACQAGAQAEIRTLLDRLEVIPELRTSLGEALHSDAILRRHPAVCVIDPLGRNNPEGFKNPHRWEDIEDLLRAGISVLTSVNLLHIEELRARVEQITGKHTRETVPQEFLTRADEIVLVDVPTELALHHKTDHLSPTGEPAERQRKLSELRELALVLAAEVVEVQLERYLRGQGIAPVWGLHERILVCITPRSNGQAMIASGIRNRDRFQGELHVVYVKQSNVSSEAKARIRGFLDEAARAGAVVQTLEGDDPVTAILGYAQAKKITQIFLGHSGRGRWYERFLGGPLHRLLSSANHMDVRIFPQ